MNTAKAIAAAALVALLVAGCSKGRKADVNNTEPAQNTRQDGAGVTEEGKTELNWLATLNDALAEAKKRDSLVLVDVYADWCGACKQLDKVTLSNEDVKKKLQDFVLLKLNADTEEQTARNLGVTKLPTAFVLDKNGEEIAHKEGFMDPKPYIAFLEAAKAKAAAKQVVPE